MLNSILNGDWSNSVPGRQFPKGDVTISELDAATSALDAANPALGASISVLGTVIVALGRVSEDIGDCYVSITLQMYNKVTNPRDIGIFSRPDMVHSVKC